MDSAWDAVDSRFSELRSEAKSRLSRGELRILGTI